MSVPSAGPPSAVLDTAFFRRWLERATAVIEREADYLTDLDSPIGDADHGANMRRGFTSGLATVRTDPHPGPGALLKAFGNHLTSTVGGASGPLYGTVMRRAGRTLGDAATVSAEQLGEALSAAVAGVRRLGDSAPGDKTMVDALAPASEAYTTALEAGSGLVDALAAAARAADEGAEATVPMRARRGRASYLGDRSIGHQDPGATSSAFLIGTLHATAAEAPVPEAERVSAPRETGTVAAGESGSAAEAPEPAPQEPAPQKEGGSAAAPAPDKRVGVVLVAHSREVAAATADLARTLVGTGDPAPIAAAGGREDGGVGTSSALVEAAVKQVDTGQGVVVLCDMGSAVLTVKSLLAETGPRALPSDVRIADAPFVEGAVAVLVTASTGAGIDVVMGAADDARTYRKV